MIYQSPITPLSPNTLHMHLHSLLGDKLTMYQLPFYMINAPSSAGDRFMVQTGRGLGPRPWTCVPRVTYLKMRYSHWLSTRRSSHRILLLALPCVYLKDGLRREEARCRLTPRYQQNWQASSSPWFGAAVHLILSPLPLLPTVQMRAHHLFVNVN